MGKQNKEMEHSHLSPSKFFAVQQEVPLAQSLFPLFEFSGVSTGTVT